MRFYCCLLLLPVVGVGVVADGNDDVVTVFLVTL